MLPILCRMGRRLRTAAAALDLHLVAALVQAGAEPAAADARGRTPLHALAMAASDDAAAEETAAPILRILLARGAEVSLIFCLIASMRVVARCNMLLHMPP